jgi:hypothetical protein
MTKPAGYITVTEATERLGVTKQRCYQLMRTDRLAWKDHAGRLWVHEASIEQRCRDRTRAESDCIDTNEVLEFFGVGLRTLRRWLAAGRLHPDKVAGVLCYDLDELISFDPGRPAPRVLRGVHYVADELDAEDRAVDRLESDWVHDGAQA